MNSNHVSSGELFLIATPIGNLDDMTIRGINTLKQCDIVFAEDTRHTRILFQHYGIAVKLDSYHAFNEHGKTQYVLDKVLSGMKVGLVTDAGTPCVADPGYLLVREAVKLGIEPRIIPGVSAVTFAVAASGLPSDRFVFYGFLPVKSGRRTARIAEIAQEKKSVIIYESPFRIVKLLKELSEILGASTPVAVIREATKLHEEILRRPVGEITAQAEKYSWKGEFAVVVYPAGADADPEEQEENLR